MVDIHILVDDAGSLSQRLVGFTHDLCSLGRLTIGNCCFNRYWNFICCRLDQIFGVVEYRKTLRIVGLIRRILNIDSSTISYGSKSNDILEERSGSPVAIGENLNKTYQVARSGYQRRVMRKITQ